LPNGAWLFFSPAKLVRPSAKRPTYTFRTNNIIYYPLRFLCVFTKR
jgi:hypothetical protein